jgi:hypothetical protein
LAKIPTADDATAMMKYRFTPRIKWSVLENSESPTVKAFAKADAFLFTPRESRKM